ncbi:MAG: SRPBCC family protein [Candidatus Bipolaricaulota bacterium]|nr:SRPBCC family protein [Candidatus Bipolaricaulota bacterium]MCS7275080.1 SRPBCC family protein [Candidatus Bipolaricaulota bacterium]MDW8110408.1 SRPBCC family protein [Candidatus Bipolaricaulota bacterium]MDW8329521.1 SRPBCC family protein [Candidatus Bipolaricaulota bacterium]
MPKIYRLSRIQVVPADLDRVWEFFATPRNLNELTPPEMHFTILSGADEPMYAGQLIEYRIQLVPGIVVSWLTEIVHVEPKRRFIDEQRFGPYKFWYHEHRFEPTRDGTRIEDHVTYALPLGAIGTIAHALWVRSRLEAIFDFRAHAIAKIFPA